jgi:hypothetical protein
LRGIFAAKGVERDLNIADNQVRHEHRDMPWPMTAVF